MFAVRNTLGRPQTKELARTMCAQHGSIRSAGGGFGKMEAAHEEEYFYKKQKEQLERLKNDQIQQAEFHHQQIKEHQEAIKRHQLFLDNVGKK